MPGPWGEALEQLRMRKRWTRARVAERAGISPTTYGRIERGLHTQTRILQRLADEVFEVPLEVVLGLVPLPEIYQPRLVPPSDHAQRLQELEAQVVLLRRQVLTEPRRTQARDSHRCPKKRRK